jgi:hypothetical protein
MSTSAARAQNRVRILSRPLPMVSAGALPSEDWFLPRFASHRGRDARERSLRARQRRDRGSVVDADTAEARELHRGMA